MTMTDDEIKKLLSPDANRMLDVCQQYCDGDINLAQAIKKYREFVSEEMTNEELVLMLLRFDRDNIIQFPRS
jgi:Ca2+-binding EF-hand superfamily protein